jgi:hypothetical protein
MAIETRLEVLLTMITRFRTTFWAGALSLPADSQPMLLHDGCRFTMVPPLSIRYPLLAKLAFIVQHESITSCTELTNERVVKSVDELVLEGRVVQLVCLGYEPEEAYVLLDNGEPKFKRNGQPSVLSGEKIITFRLHADSAHICLSTDTKKDWLIVPADRNGRKKAIYFQDALNCDGVFARHLAKINSFTTEEDGTVTVSVQMNRMDHETFGCEWPVTPGEVFHLYKRYINLHLVKKVTDQLTILDNAISAGETPLFVRLIERPDSWDTENRPGDALMWRQLNAQQQAIIANNHFNMQPSQLEALSTAVSRHLTVCWGPPGMFNCSKIQ